MYVVYLCGGSCVFYNMWGWGYAVHCGLCVTVCVSVCRGGGGCMLFICVGVVVCCITVCEGGGMLCSRMGWRCAV